MSKKRYIDSHFWSDTWVDTLTRDEKFFFLYLLTNNKTNIAGVYEIPVKMMAFESEFTKVEIVAMFERMKAKIRYIDGWVVMRNGVKNQNYKNEKIRRGIELVFEQCPADCLEFVDIPKDFHSLAKKKPKQQRLIDDSSMSLDVSSHSDSNLNLNSNLNSDAGSGKPEQSANQDFKGSEDWTRKQKFEYYQRMEAERQQKARAETARSRKPSKTISIADPDKVNDFYDKRTFRKEDN